MTSNMIYIVALGVGFKCPRKIHLNAQYKSPLMQDWVFRMGSLHNILIEAGVHECINKLFMYLYGRDESLSWIKHLGCRMRRLFWSDEPRSVKIGHTV